MSIRQFAAVLAAGFVAVASAGAAMGGATDASGDTRQAATFTATQVAAGKTEYAAHCTDCHGPNLNDGEFGGPPLKGEAFRSKWFGQPASALIGFANTTMPPDSPGRLPLETYAEIVAYVLSENGVAPGTRALPADMEALDQLDIQAETAPGNAAQ